MPLDHELEAKFVGVNPDDIRARLMQVGAVLLQPERLMHRQTFDFPDLRLQERGGWVRVRNQGDKVTMSYKEIKDDSIEGMKEVELVVDSMEKASTFLLSLGLFSKSNQENRRETWCYKACQITIDTWPWVPAAVEVEGSSQAIVQQIAEELGFNWAEALFGGIEPLYKAFYDVTSEDVKSWKEMLFSPVPAWLEEKRKK